MKADVCLPANFRRILTWLALPAAGAATLVGSEPLDADREPQIRFETPRTVDREAFTVEDNAGLTDRRFPIREWSAFFSPLGQRRAPIDGDVRQPEKIREKRELTFPVRLRDAARDPEDRPVLTLDVDRIREASADSRFADADVVTVDLGRAGFEAIVDELSMQDINRYQFDRNRSTEPGLPVQRPRPGRSDRVGTHDP